VTVTASRFRPLPYLLFAAGLAALYASALGTGFLNDDFLFLEDARAHGIRGALSATGALANYFRPLSRQAWFAVLTPVSGGHALVFHVASFAVFLVATWLVFDLLRAFTTRGPAIAGTLYFATLPLQQVNLTWVSCSQDLLAVAGSLAALAFYRRRRDRAALLAFLAAVLSKQSALPLPALLFLWSWRIDGVAARSALRRVAPFALPVLAWGLGEWHLRAHAVAPAHLSFEPLSFLAALVHMGQSLLGLEQPSGLPRAFLDAGPSVLALACFAPLVAWLPAAGPGPEAPAAARHAGGFALTWLALFVLPVGPVASAWSAYFYTTCAVGGALGVAVLCRRLPRWGFIALTMTMLWWHAAAVAVPAFAVAEDPWTWTSHLSPYYFERGAALAARLRTALVRTEPRPPAGTRFFFATLPPWAGFQMGNGAAIRDLYRDPSLESFFYSQFGESTAANHPCVFLFWNGVDFERLYDRGRDPFFQVGADLLLLDRPAGAVHAFRRGLAAGETRVDHLYWLGWACLWSGDRDAGEQAWKAFGAADDTTMYRAWMRAADSSLDAGDTTAARRQLFEAIRAGIGRPEAHAGLGELLRGRSDKFALLETKVTAFLKPNDWLARRDMAEGLTAAHLDDAAWRALDALRAIYPEWRSDSIVVRVAGTLEGRAPATRAVASFSSHH